MSTETPITAPLLAKYLPLMVSAAIALAVSAFGWGVTYATLDGRVSRLEAEMPRLEQVASQPVLEARLMRIEQLVGQLVCLDARADKELCRKAIADMGRP